jgi:gluconokinase
VGDTTTAVIMGVSGAGKTTVAKGIAERWGWEYAEGDDFHSSANRAKMAAGHPLDDDDRWPWLRAIAAWIGSCERRDENAVVTCSALKRSYRDLLRDGHPSVVFVALTPAKDELAQRLARRKGHYIPASLLESQLDTLQPLSPDEPAISISAYGEPADVLSQVLVALTIRAL